MTNKINYKEMTDLAKRGLSSAKDITCCLNRFQKVCGTGFIISEALGHASKLTTLFYDLKQGLREKNNMSKKKKIKKDGKQKKKGIQKRVTGKITSVDTNEKEDKNAI